MQALEDRPWLHDNLSPGRRVAPQSARGCRRHPVQALIAVTIRSARPHAPTSCGCCASALSGCKDSLWCCSLARRPQRRRPPLGDRRGHRPPDGPRRFRASGGF